MCYVNTKDLNDLLSGPTEQIAEACAVDPRTVQRWKSGKVTPPPSIIKLLQLRFGDLSGLLGTEWEGFYVGNDKRLYMPGWKYGWDAHEIKAMFFKVKQADWYRRQYERLTVENATLRAQVWAAEKVRQAVTVKQ